MRHVTTKPRTLNRWALAFLLLLLGCDPQSPMLAQSAAEGGSSSASDRDQVEEQLGTLPDEVDTSIALELSSAFRAAASSTLPSVVFIEVEKEVSQGPTQLPDFFRFFFDAPQRQFEAPPPQVGSGSGFVLDEEGHIVTNHHVVAGASRILVRLLDGREFEAELVGSDASTDVAVIEIEPPEEGLNAAELGESGKIRVGDWVLALGSPLGLDFTVTAGIVSAKGRQITGRQAALESFIQTDAAINPGNSGGPLVDLAGRVIGINTAIAGGARFVGYGFAIPIDLGQRVIRDLLEYGVVRRPRLGVQIQDVTAVDAEAFGLEEVRGAQVRIVESGTPAEEAGLEPGDVILSLDGEEIEDATELTTALAQYDPGDEVTLGIVREGERSEIEVTLGQFEQTADSGQNPEERTSAASKLGFTVEALTPELARRLGHDETEGVVIAQVSRFSAAANAGIRPGQRILQINGQSVRSPADVRDIAAEIEPGAVVSIRVEIPEVGETIINYRTRE